MNMKNPNRILVCESGKDGGPESHVMGYWLFRWKRLCTIVLLHFMNGSREAYHDHAFNSISWVLRGKLTEHHLLSGAIIEHKPSFKPVITKRNTFHKVYSEGDTLVLSFRGPWVDKWHESVQGERITLTHGREIVNG